MTAITKLSVIQRTVGIVLIMALAWSNTTAADVIGAFVDATPANTTAMDGSVAITAIADDQNNGYWRQRAGGWGQNGTTILEARYVDPIDMKTVITGLAPGQEYTIYVLYSGWTTAVSPMAGLSAGNLSLASNSAFIHTTGADGFDHKGVLESMIGNTTADANGEIVVYIDGDPAGARTWYDGVAYDPVPEPTVIGLLLLGSAVVRRRRK